MKGRFPRRRSFPAIAVVLASTVVGCGSSDVVVPVEVASVEVTSPVRGIIAVGRSAQLSAVARDAQGRQLSPTFTWTSSNTDAATVNATGLVSGIASGNATITAEAEGRSGSVAVRVVAADLGTIASILTDPLRSHLVTNLAEARQAVESALTAGDQALEAGDIEALHESLFAVRTQAGSAANADDRAILATLVLLTDFAIGLLNL